MSKASRAFESLSSTEAHPTPRRNRLQLGLVGVAVAGSLAVTALVSTPGSASTASEAVPAVAVSTIDAAPDRDVDLVSRSGTRVPVETPSVAPEITAPAAPETTAPATTAPATTAPATTAAAAPATTASKAATTASKAATSASQAPTTAATKAAAPAAAATTKAATSGVAGSYGACASGSGVESGLTANAVRLHRAICNTFPYVTSYGGLSGGDEHGTGRAIDAMCSGAQGQAVANWLVANSSSLGVIEVIYAQKIWTLQRSSEGWRSMSDRGSATANHYDHVHVMVR